MDKPLVCMEISSGAIRMVVGHEMNGAPIALYTKEIKIPGMFKDGELVDENAAIKALASFHNIVDEQEKLQLNITRINIVLPSVGLQVYQNDKTTNVIAMNNQIEKIDISNVVSLVRKETVPGGNQIVDIIPDEYVLDTGERFSNPPLGNRSKSLTIKAKIHALPSRTAQLWGNLTSKAGYRVNKSCVSAYCAATLFKTYKDLPQNYILVDIGEHITDVSLIGGGTPYACGSFYEGGRDLTEEIADGFGVSFEEAERVKIRYGYEPKKMKFNPPVVEGRDGADRTSPFFQKDLNNVITAFFENYGGLLANSVDSLLARYQGKFDTLPIIVTGGGSLLRGLPAFLRAIFPKRESIIAAPRTIGARNPAYVNVLGLLLASSKYTGSLEDNYRGMTTVSRVGGAGQKKQGGKRKDESAEEDAL
ncbi:MAG: rod shape-determining protein [Bacilli bacterium]|nr:rod shape-determining protein [Bacilli bacterium]